MKHFAMIGVAALLVGGFYAFGSTSEHRSVTTNQSKIYSVAVSDTVPRRGDTVNRNPSDTMSRKDTVQRRDSLQ